MRLHLQPSLSLLFLLPALVLAAPAIEPLSEPWHLIRKGTLAPRHPPPPSPSLLKYRPPPYHGFPPGKPPAETIFSLMPRNVEMDTGVSNPMDRRGSEDFASVTVCEHVYWAGTCNVFQVPIGTNACIKLDGESSSIGPNEGFTCTLYKNAICRAFGTDDVLAGLQYPGNPNLIYTAKGNFNNAVLGIQCYRL